MDRRLHLSCLMRRFQISPTDVCTFEVQVSKDGTIGELKEIIMNNRPDLDFEVKNLRLFKVDIPNDYDNVIKFYNNGSAGEELLTTRCVKDYWTDIPEKNIHILVETPKQVIFIPVTGAPEAIIKPRNEFEKIIGCESTEMSPILYGLPGYELYMYGDEFGLLKNRTRNPLATVLLYGRKLNEVPGVRGPVVLTDACKSLTLDDFRYILSPAKNLN